VPFDVRNRLEVLRTRQGNGLNGKTTAPAAPASPDGKTAVAGTVAPPGDGKTAPADTAPGAMRGLLPGRRNRQRRGEGAPDPAKAAQSSYERPAPSPGVKPIGSIQAPGRATVEGRVRAVEIRPVERSSVLACEISDSTGDLTALFYGRSHIPGIICGSRVRFRGSVGIRDSGPIMINPAYELLAAGESPPNAEG